MPEERRSINVKKRLLDAAICVYEENRAYRAATLIAEPSLTQIAEGGLRLFVDFLEGKLIYREDLPGLQRAERGGE